MTPKRSLFAKLKNYWYLIPEAPEDRNYFGFQSPDELLAALNDPDVTYDYAGSPLPRSLYTRHHTTTFPQDAPYAVAWTRYHDDEDFLKAVHSYRGFLIVNDTLDQLYPIRHLYRLCRERGWVYIKHNMLPPRAALNYLVFRAFPFSALWYWRFYAAPYERLYPGVFNPHRHVISAGSEIDTNPAKERPLDLLFIGSKYQGRWEKIQAYAAAAEKIGASFEFIEGGLSAREYLDKMSRTKICLSFVGWAPRCRREWEIMLAGSLLLNDAALRWQTGGTLPLMQAGEHFVWGEADIAAQLDYWLQNETERLRVAAGGHDLAQACFSRTPTVEWRLLYQWMTQPDFRWDGTYESLVNAEKSADVAFPRAELF